MKVIIIPVPDTSGIPPFADFEAIKSKLNELVAKYNNLLVNLDSLNVVSLTADHIDTGTLDAGKVTVRADLTGGAYIQIDSTDGLVINNGVHDTFKADINGNVTMTSALIQSATGYPKVVLDPSGNIFGAYLDADNYIEINPVFGGGSPAISATVEGNTAYQLTANTSGVVLSTGAKDLTLSTIVQGNINLFPESGYDIHVPGWDRLVEDSSGEALATALSNKANVFTGVSGTVFVAATSGGPTTKAITFVNGIRTS